jgi:hypothetical protein
VGLELTLEQGRAAAQSVALAVLGDLKRELGDLDRIVAWLRVFGLVNAAPAFSPPSHRWVHGSYDRALPGGCSDRPPDSCWGLGIGPECAGHHRRRGSGFLAHGATNRRVTVVFEPPSNAQVGA